MDRRIYWQTPATMLGSLLMGILFAIGHHLFYQHLEGTAVLTAEYEIAGSQVSSQQANIAIGTALAFLCKASLVLAVSISYLQVFWHAAIAAGGKGRLTLGQIDSAYSALNNFLAFFHLKVWWMTPLALLSAVTAWLLPIASIITPATLSVEMAPASPPSTDMLNVPNLDFRSFRFLAEMPSRAFRPDFDTDPVSYWYNGPSQLVERVATAVASLGQILPIAHPAGRSNASYTLDFHGPALSCQAMESGQSIDVQQQIVDYAFSKPQYCGSPYGYLAWTSSRLPLVPSASYKYVDDHGETEIRRNYTLVSDSLSPDLEPATLYAVAVPALWRMVAFNSHAASPLCIATPQNEASNQTEPLGRYGAQFAAIQCQLYNSTYKVGFDYTEGDQDISINNDLDIAAGPIMIARKVYGPRQSDSFSCSNVSETLSLSPDDCDFNQTLLQTLAYEAVMDAFNRLLVGSVSANLVGDGGELALNRNSSIMSTTLVQAPEPQFLRDREPVRDYGGAPESTYASLQTILSGYESTIALLRGITNAEETSLNT
ncbi:hypothetical protein K431DRAFT_308282 [Polychaeton citri CBS 116435]|uniref:Uncharacterized protein n=1 Tax=Polychaeton citri CBS 116435 TaxID=1314669 RepID=A0A9P4UKE5_9PEZI|nr:hypothetical protein K431DRAFT_308282 [Polychaeton citri CBS 116435]